MHRALLAAGSLCFLGLGAASAANTEAAKEEEPTQLDPITVEAPPFLYESDRQLNKVKRSLPDMGGDAPVTGIIASIRKFYEQRKDPNDLGPFQQEMLLRALGERGEQ